MPHDDRVVINANIAIAGETLQTIVQTAKRLKGVDARGHYRIDTADLISSLISQFLLDQGFDAYVADARLYHAVLVNGESG